MSMAVRVDHLAIPQPQALVSPFGVLSDAFTQSILDRLRVKSGLYQPYLLEYLFEEPGAGYYTAPVYNIDFSLNLELVKNIGPQYAEADKERVERIVERLMAERIKAGQERWHSNGLSVNKYHYYARKMLAHHHNQIFPRSIDNIVSSLYTSYISYTAQLQASQEASRTDSNRAVLSLAMVQPAVFPAFVQPGVAGSPFAAAISARSLNIPAAAGRQTAGRFMETTAETIFLAATPGRDKLMGIAPGGLYRPTAQPGVAGSAASPAFVQPGVAGSPFAAAISARSLNIPAAAGRQTAGRFMELTAETIFLAATPGRDKLTGIAPDGLYRPPLQSAAAGSAAFPALIGPEIAVASRVGLSPLSASLFARAFNIPTAAGRQTAARLAEPTAETVFLAATPGRDKLTGIAPDGLCRPTSKSAAAGSAAFPALIGPEIAAPSRARLSTLSAALSARAFNIPVAAGRQTAERLTNPTAETIFLAATPGRDKLTGIAPDGLYRPTAQSAAAGSAAFAALIGPGSAGASRAGLSPLSAGLSARTFNKPAAGQYTAERLNNPTAETVFLAASERDSLTDITPGSFYRPSAQSAAAESMAFAALIGPGAAGASRAGLSPLSAGLSARAFNIPTAAGQHTAKRLTDPTAKTVFLTAPQREGLTGETPGNIYESIAGQPVSPAIFHRAAIDQPQAGHLSRTAAHSRHIVHAGKRMPAHNRFIPELPQRMRMANMTRRDDISGSLSAEQRRQAYLPAKELKYVLPANLDTIHNKITNLPMPTPDLSGNSLLAKPKPADSLPAWANDFLRQSFIHPQPPAESDEVTQNAQIRQPLSNTSHSGAAQALPAVARFQQQRPAADGQMVWTAPGYTGHLSVMEHRHQEELQTPPPAHFSNAEINRMANKVYEILEERIAREKRRLGL